MQISSERLIADLRALAEFGRCGTGVDRPAFSDADILARRWLEGRMAEAGLETSIDRVGNVFGKSPAAGPALLFGSHTDSVPRGGWLDGALGVIYGLEIARAFADAKSGAAIDVIAFQDEEGAHLPCLGSRSFCEELENREIDSASGGHLLELIAEHGLAGAAPTHLDRSRTRAYLEAHIEQGPRLEAKAKRIGIVTGIVSIRRFRVRAEGQADHAGTTPMDMRKDAGAALIHLAHAMLDEMPRLAGPDTVWNCGNVVFEPGAANVVPSASELILEVRDAEGRRLDQIEERIMALVSAADRHSQVSVAATKTADVDGIAMDSELGKHIADAAKENGAPSMSMPSGAGHDAMILARHLPSAMLFIPSIGGRSHDITEDTDEADIILGCQVLAHAAASILTT